MESELWYAANNGAIEKVRALSNDPYIDLNWRNEDTVSIFFTACHNGNTRVVIYFMQEHPRRNEMDFNLETDNGATPFHYVCSQNFADILSLMIDDPRIDVNRPDKVNQTPLFRAVLYSRYQTVRLLLSSGRDIDTGTRSTGGFYKHEEGKTAADFARYMSTDHVKEPWMSEEDFQQHRADDAAIADLIETYEKNPAKARNKIRMERGLTNRDVGGLFALSVLFSDGYLSLNRDHELCRFFEICSKLPLELQMVISNRTYGSSRDIVNIKQIEPFIKTFLSETNNKK